MDKLRLLDDARWRADARAWGAWRQLTRNRPGAGVKSVAVPSRFRFNLDTPAHSHNAQECVCVGRFARTVRWYGYYVPCITR